MVKLYQYIYVLACLISCVRDKLNGSDPSKHEASSKDMFQFLVKYVDGHGQAGIMESHMAQF